ncbi:phage tail family protein [Actinoplanes sp. NPDC049265]|uniref:phage tail family protein n=1 Tax=Actinoplanes sp. NPDC049265 TaxID=3363902 RepID=UPI003722D030
MPHLVLESATDSLNLDDVAQTGSGVQALTGATGLGFPDVAAQWIEGAGDGATYRGSRLRSRDIDLPLHLLADNRQGLRALVARLEVMLAEKCVLRFVEDDGTDWSTPVAWQGGGKWVYGTDTTGTRELSTVITLRAGSPYWTSSTAISQRITNAGGGRGLLNGSLANLRVAPSQAIGTIVLENSGTAPAYPVWAVTGPGKNFAAISPTGQVLRWTGTLSAGETLILDTQAGTVTDAAGANRYAGLAAAPRFWAVPPGTSTATASLDDASTASVIVCTWRPRKRVVI